MTRPLRSVLFMPATNARAVAKARDLPCDAVILDLEDAVAPDRKGAAREAAVAAVREGGFGARPLVVRVNGLGSEWIGHDLDALGEAAPDAVLVPKVGSAHELRWVRARLPGPALWAMVESAAGLMALPGLAAQAEDLRLTTLVAGTNDLALDLRCRPGEDRWPLVPALAQIVTAARAGGMAALDGVLNALGDAARLEAECSQGAALGFDGKTLVHPDQIGEANRAFGPSEAEVARARAIVAAFADPDADGKGAIRLGGEMVERLHLAEAERVLALSPSPALAGEDGRAVGEVG